MGNITDLDSHFKFGENWADYARTITKEKIAVAIQEISVLLDMDSLEGKTFLDVGCGSGIHSLAALALGAKKVIALDIDPDSVKTTHDVLSKNSVNNNWECFELSVFELDALKLGKFDVVYSWGVLHHTGDLWRAVEKTAFLVQDSGFLAIAIYIKTPFCWVWKWEKRLYSKFPRFLQKICLNFFASVWLLGKLVKGINPVRYIREYHGNRGMNFFHDCHDWLGGYPYESATPDEVIRALSNHGFKLLRKFKTDPPLGVFGTWCAEYVFQMRLEE